jgi:protein-S-isoprenylcysteine O-methyltransferase Ste14
VARVGGSWAQAAARLLMRIPVPWMFVSTYLCGVGFEYLAPVRVTSEGTLGFVVSGAVLFCVGAVIAGWSWAIFHRAGTTRVPGQVSTTLVTWGPYRCSRNPMYVGLAVAYLGEAALLKQVWPIVVLPLMLAYLNWIVIPIEEARLRRVFLDAYDSYRATVRRWV